MGSASTDLHYQYRGRYHDGDKDMIAYTLGILTGIAACLVVNYLVPPLFAKLTRKAGKVVDGVKDRVN